MKAERTSRSGTNLKALLVAEDVVVVVGVVVVAAAVIASVVVVAVADFALSFVKLVVGITIVVDDAIDCDF
jgi:hypothetical protein